jgi:hypothetical protein
MQIQIHFLKQLPVAYARKAAILPLKTLSQDVLFVQLEKPTQVLAIQRRVAPVVLVEERLLLSILLFAQFVQPQSISLTLIWTQMSDVFHVLLVITSQMTAKTTLNMFLASFVSLEQNSFHQ